MVSGASLALTLSI